MRVILSKKGRIVSFIAVFLIALGVGLVLENMRNDEFSVESNVQLVQQSDIPKDDQIINGKININTADRDTLMLITGIGENYADKIISYREENGPFQTIEEIMNVSGIGSKKFEKMRDMICTE